MGFIIQFGKVFIVCQGITSEVYEFIFSHPKYISGIGIAFRLRKLIELPFL